jgi:hypothetical protein
MFKLVQALNAAGFRKILNGGAMRVPVQKAERARRMLVIVELCKHVHNWLFSLVAADEDVVTVKS